MLRNRGEPKKIAVVCAKTYTVLNIEFRNEFVNESLSLVYITAGTNYVSEILAAISVYKVSAKQISPI